VVEHLNHVHAAMAAFWCFLVWMMELRWAGFIAGRGDYFDAAKRLAAAWLGLPQVARLAL